MKTYIVTDPCYIIPDPEWGRMSERNKWNENISNYLESVTKSDAWCFDTGYGDWANVMSGDGVHEDHDEFTADAGMVCVCEYTDEIQRHIRHTELPDYCYALVDMEGSVDVQADRSDRHWTVITITNGEHSAYSCHA